MATHEGLEHEGSRHAEARDRRELDIAWGRVGQEVVAPGWSRPVGVAAAAPGGAACTVEPPVALAPPPSAAALDGVWLVRGTTARAGQSCLTVALALAWAARGSRVLVLDLDPAEDLARTLHVGWALRPGTSHTLVHALEEGWLDPAPSLVAGLEIASLGALPTQRPALAGVVPPPLRGLLPRRYDRVLIDLPFAAGLPGLAALADLRVDVSRDGAIEGDPRVDLPPRRATILNAAGDRTGEARPSGAVGGADGSPVLRFPAFERPELGPWGLLTGAAGPRVEHAALELSRRLDALGAGSGAAVRG